MSSEREFFNQINQETGMFENLSKYVIPNELNHFAKKARKQVKLFSS